MVVQKWLLSSLSDVLARNTENEPKDEIALQGVSVNEKGQRSAASRKLKELTRSQREWQSAITSLEQLLLQFVYQSDRSSDLLSLQGLVLAGPVPVLSHPDLLGCFQTGIFTTETLKGWSWMPFQLPPAQQGEGKLPSNNTYELALFPADPLAAEQFCLVFTHHFSLVMVCGEDQSGIPAFRYSFDPEDVEKAWLSLYPRMVLTSPHQLNHLEGLVREFVPQAPDYRIVMEFGRLLLRNLPEVPQVQKNEPIVVNSTSSTPQTPKPQAHSDTVRDRNWQRLVKNEQRSGNKLANITENNSDVELLQALTHEIRTPLTTIRTLTKLLLKRRDLAPEVIRRLEIIDHECTEQINRMELIFRAVELETTPVKETSLNLTSMSLDQVFQQSIPRWQKQAQRRNLTLDVVLPQNLPTVVSNPAMLDQVLTGLVENFTRSLSAGGHIQIEVTPAGDQLKLQFQSQPDPENPAHNANLTNSTCSTLKSIGQLLMFQPETGSLSLNLNVTKHLFQALGGKLIVRQRPQAGEVMTIFLPLEVGNGVICSTRINQK